MLWVPAQLLDLLSDVLIQLLRNALAHGIETTEQRLAAGKSATGNIRIEQSLDGMQIDLLFADDGAGLQTAKIRAAAGQQNAGDINELIFQAGLSTASTPDLLSGRGIGLDLVRQHIQQLDGTIMSVQPRVKAVFSGSACRCGKPCKRSRLLRWRISYMFYHRRTLLRRCPPKV